MNFLRNTWREYLEFVSRFVPEKYRPLVAEGRAIGIVVAITVAQLTLYAAIALAAYRFSG